MAYYDEIANRLARDVLEAQKVIDDHLLVKNIADTLEETSSTLHEAFNTAVRVYAAEERARALLDQKLKEKGFELKK